MPANVTDKLAIIGYAGIFPQADSPEALWDLLCAERDTFTEIPPDRWPLADFYSEDKFARNKSSAKWMAAIDLPGAKQAIWPEFPATEHATVDPQQLLLLHVTGQTLAHAGLSASTLAEKRVSVSVGCMDSENMHNQLLSDLPVGPGTVFGNYQALLANRISQHFGFTGESKAINTACSASFMALSDARAQLVKNGADYAIVAAANLNLHPLKYYAFAKAGMLSRSGSCTPFAITADGYVPGDCIAALCVTTLERALKEHHPVHAVIEGMAGNHNGNRAVSPTAPSVAAQIELLNLALADADLPAQAVSYLEAHGTGTSLGDPLEIEALAHVYGHHPCQVGSVKGVIGHTEAAAGLAAIIKTLLMFRFNAIPGNHWAKTLNPLVAERLAQLQIARQRQEWTAMPRRIAGISSFGSGGANGHIILGEWRASSRPAIATEPLPAGFYLCENNSSAPRNLTSWLAGKPWRPDPVQGRFCRNAFWVSERQTERLQPVTTLPLLSEASLNNSPHVLNLLLCPIGVVAATERYALSSADLLSLLPVGSLQLAPQGAMAKLPTTFVQALASLPDSLAALSPAWLIQAKELERYQFTFKLLVAKWKKHMPCEPDAINERLAYAMAYSDLYDKWSLQPKIIPASLGVIRKLLNAALFQERQFAAWFGQEELIVDKIVCALAEAIAAGKAVPTDIFDGREPGTVVYCAGATGYDVETLNKEPDPDVLVIRSWIGKKLLPDPVIKNSGLSLPICFSD
ncbi:beta-ketoacyl synthase N-terminal-like domain-containing protein [Erwinia sp.]|uniref:polyketide synthase n=1 Tax=Erwinia citreus TaxID=558 RepID=UPI0028A05A00|nr:beta-ketoacyl synthase N-terminal-like domain-containing protein [Erwinia sp.]